MRVPAIKKVAASLLILALAAGGYLLVRAVRAPPGLRATHTTPGPLPKQARDRDPAGQGATLRPHRRTITTSTVDARALMAADVRRVALSPEEVDWLRRHYYPDDQDLASLDSLDLQALRGTQDPRLATLQGLALIRRGDPEVGALVLLSAGAMGAIYAYEEGAIADHQVMVKRVGATLEIDDVLRARLEVAKMLGDHRADDLVRTYLPNYPMAERAALVQRQASEFFRQLGNDAQLRGATAPGPDLRPNLKQWQALKALTESGGSTSVVVYSQD